MLLFFIGTPMLKQFSLGVQCIYGECMKIVAELAKVTLIWNLDKSPVL